MADLKIDLINKISNDKYYEELELIRLAQDPNMNYREKIDEMSQRLANISFFNAELVLVQQYFQQPAPVPGTPPVPNAGGPVAGPPVPAPAGQVHPGQTHGE